MGNKDEDVRAGNQVLSGEEKRIRLSCCLKNNKHRIETPTLLKMTANREGEMSTVSINFIQSLLKFIQDTNFLTPENPYLNPTPPHGHKVQAISHQSVGL